MIPNSSSPHPAEPILIAGLGSIGRRHLANLRLLGCSRFVIYRTFKSTMPEDTAVDSQVTSDLHEALSLKPRIAIISNPTALHLDVALPAAEAGCHLYIEKPLSHSLERCQELADVVERKRLVTMIGCQFRFHPLLISLRDQLRNGRIGKVIEARAEWGEYLPDWHPWEDYRQSYSARADLGGGVILTLIHPVDYLMWMFGPVERTAGVTRDVSGLETEVSDDWAELTLDFASGVAGKVHLDYEQRPPVHRLHVCADQGQALWDYHAGTLRWEDAKGRTECQRVPEGFERNTMFLDAMREFLDAVEHRRASAIPLDEGIAALEVALAAKQSAAKEARRV